MKQQFNCLSTTGKRFVLTYSDDLLSGIQFEEGHEPGAIEEVTMMFAWIAQKCRTVAELTAGGANRKWKITPMERQAPSFNEFWERYGVKLDRKRCEQIWVKLPDAEKVKAYEYIPRYDNKLKRAGIFKKQPKQYLNGEIWNDD